MSVNTCFSGRAAQRSAAEPLSLRYLAAEPLSHVQRPRRSHREQGCIERRSRLRGGPIHFVFFLTQQLSLSLSLSLSVPLQASEYHNKVSAICIPRIRQKYTFHWPGSQAISHSQTDAVGRHGSEVVAACHARSQTAARALLEEALSNPCVFAAEDDVSLA